MTTTPTKEFVDEGTAASSGAATTATQAAHSHGGATGSASEVLTFGALRFVDHMSPPAKGATVHAQAPAGAPLNLVAGFTAAFPARNLVIQRGGAGNATTYVVTYVRFGQTIVANMPSDGANDIVGGFVYDSITSITTAGDPGVTSDFVTGDMLGLSTTATAIDRAGVAANNVSNYVVENATLNAAGDGVTFTTAPNGAKHFRVQCSYSPSATPAGHTHSIASATPTITVTD